MTATIIDASGVRPAADALEVGKQVAADRFFWLDISGGDLSLSQIKSVRIDGAVRQAQVDLRCARRTE